MTDSDDFIGPALPPSLKSKNDEQDEIGPQVPPHLLDNLEPLSNDVGPKLPDCTSQEQEEKTDDADEQASDDSFGPVLPPNFKQSHSSDEKVHGPQLPDGFTRNITEVSDDEDDIIGPLPPKSEEIENGKYSIANEFEKRSQRMKDRLEGREQPKKLEREEWMTELPPVLQGNFGMGPRQFRARPSEVGDRSGWTDTPGDKQKKSKEKSNFKEKEPTATYIQERDSRIAQQLENYKESDKGESLLSMHEKKRKRKLKEEEESGEANIRRPFDRDVDLQVNRFDEAAKKRMMKKSAGLASRFAHGETSGTFL